MAKVKSVVDLIEKISVALSTAKNEAQDFEEKENASAGLRTRKALKEVKDLAQAGRKLVTEIKKSRKVNKKSKAKKVDKKKK